MACCELTTPPAQGLPLAVFWGSLRQDEDLLTGHGFLLHRGDMFPDERVLREKPGVKKAGGGRSSQERVLLVTKMII